MPDQTQPSISVISIKINGADAFELEADIDEVIVDTTYNLPAMASIRLQSPELRWIDNPGPLKLGSALIILMGAPGSVNSVPPAQVFDGQIVALEPHFSSQGTHSLTIRAYDRSHLLHLGTKSRTFLNLTDSNIVSKIAQENGLSANVTATTIQYEYVLQNNITDMEFLSERAQRIGYHFSVSGSQLNFVKAANPPLGPTITLGEDLRDFSMRLSAARQSDKFTVRGWDFQGKREIVATANPSVTWRTNGHSQSGGATAASALKSSNMELVTLAPQTFNEANLLASSAALDQEGQFIEADGVAFGNPKLVAGVQVDVQGVGKSFSGKYYVTSATHIFNSAGYDVHFTVAGRYPQTINRLLKSAQQGQGMPGTVQGVVIGIVTNVGDPLDLGRVKVKFPWLSESIESNWARLAMPSAGSNRGFYFLPEVNDEVLVAFEHGNVNCPYIVGALWNGRDLPPEKNSIAHVRGKTEHRIIASRLNHRIVFDDSNGNRSILIEDTTTKQSIFIDSIKNSITVKADGDLLIDVKGNIDIKAGGNINMKAVRNIKAEGVNVNLEATAAVGMKGNASATVESSAQTTVKGSITEVSAAGPTTIKGTPIMLN